MNSERKLLEWRRKFLLAPGIKQAGDVAYLNAKLSEFIRRDVPIKLLNFYALNEALLLGRQTVVNT